MTIKTLKDLFIHMLSDMYNAEKQITRALPKMARAASEPQLADAFKAHLEQTHGQIERIDKIVDVTKDVRLKRIKCVGMEGIIEEGQEIIDSVEKGPLCDAGLIGAAQKVEHYEIATYGTLSAMAKQLGYREAEQLLNETLKEEKDTDSKLSRLAAKQASQKPQANAAVAKTTASKSAGAKKAANTKPAASKSAGMSKTTTAKPAANKPAAKTQTGKTAARKPTVTQKTATAKSTATKPTPTATKTAAAPKGVINGMMNRSGVTQAEAGRPAANKAADPKITPTKTAASKSTASKTVAKTNATKATANKSASARSATSKTSVTKASNAKKPAAKSNTTNPASKTTKKTNKK